MKNQALSHIASVTQMLSRRNLLRHTALAALLSPIVRLRDAEAATSPRRVILIYSGNGTIGRTGPCTENSSENTFTVDDWWQPLARHSRDGIFMSHMAATGAGVVPGNGHGLGGQMYSGFGAEHYRAKGPSIDQIIARRLRDERRQGVAGGVVWGLAGGATGEGFSAGYGRDVRAELDPFRAWQSLFARFIPASEGGSAAAETMIKRQRSMLDFVNKDCKAMASDLGTSGVRLLADHCESLRTLELQIDAKPVAPFSQCGNAAAPAALTWTNPENVDKQMDAFVRLMSVALSCELTHVIAFQLSGQAARNRLAASYNVPASPRVDSGDSGPAHHPWTHMSNGPEKSEGLSIFNKFYSTKIAQLVDALKTNRDVHSKPLLDSTVVLWLSELGGDSKHSEAHATYGMPAIIFGNGQGTFKSGRYVRGKCPPGADGRRLPDQVEAGKDMARVLVSMMRYMGLNDVKTVGTTGVEGPFMPLYGA